MKLFTAVLSLIAAAVAASSQQQEQVMISEIQADSNLGRKVMSMARRLEQNGQDYYSQLYDWDNAFSDAWVAGYSIKFQGCHHVSQWNNEANDEQDVRILNKRLARFRLCPSGSCSSSDSNGCSGGYGDYVIDLNSFLQAYIEARKEAYNNGGAYRYDENNANQDQVQDQAQTYEDFSTVTTYMQCARAGFRRQLQNNNDNQDAQNAQNNVNQQYYIGPYCATQGGAVYLGVFVDDSCTTFADSNGGRDTYLTMTGEALPYGSSSIIASDCLSCKEGGQDWYNQDAYAYYAADVADEDDVLQVCEGLYNRAGKCESSLPYGTTYKNNNNACNYIQGIKAVRSNGTVITASEKANQSAQATISVLSIAFVALSGYVYYLKSKLDLSSINLDKE
jgi:hypothetical protein